MKKIFGIIGGHGAVATSHFQQLLLQEYLAQGSYKDTDFPHTIITNVPLGEINEAGKIKNRESIRQLIDFASQILAPANYTLVLCNTFHIEQEYMEQILPGTFLSLPLLTHARIQQNSYKKVLLVGTELTLENNLHPSTTYTTVQYVSEPLIEAGMKGQTDHPDLTTIVELAKNENVDAIALVCTDLSVFQPKLETLTSLPILDSLLIAAQTIKEKDSTNESL